MAHQKAADAEQLQKEEEAAIKMQSAQRGKRARERCDKKKNAERVEKKDFFGAVTWEVVLTKKESKHKYVFSHANAKVQFLQEYAKASKPKGNNNASSNSLGRNDTSGTNLSSNDPSSPTGNASPDLLSPMECPEALIVKRVNEQGLMEEWNFIHPEAE